MEEIAKINLDDYFKAGDPSLLKSQSYSNELLMRLTIIVNSIADRINGLDQLDRLTIKKTEERVARLEEATRENAPRGLGG